MLSALSKDSLRLLSDFRIGMTGLELRTVFVIDLVAFIVDFLHRLLLLYPISVVDQVNV